MNPIAPNRVLNMAELPASFPDSTHYLWSCQDQHVYVRGFSYPYSSGQGILASSPNLKSCCIGSHATIFQQIAVKGNGVLPQTQHAITLEGIFKINPLYNAEGQLVQLYVLEEGREVPSSSVPLFSVVLVFILGLVLILSFFKRQR